MTAFVILKAGQAFHYVGQSVDLPNQNENIRTNYALNVFLWYIDYIALPFIHRLEAEAISITSDEFCRLAKE
jgi:hypothetical protein